MPYKQRASSQALPAVVLIIITMESNIRWLAERKNEMTSSSSFYSCKSTKQHDIIGKSGVLAEQHSLAGSWLAMLLLSSSCNDDDDDGDDDDDDTSSTCCPATM